MENQIVKVPTVGRIVHYYPVNDSICKASNAEFVPAIIVQCWGNLMSNIQVFTMNPDAQNVLRYSVHHKSELLEGSELSYWEYPPII